MERGDFHDRDRRRFRIWVQGRLDARFADGLDGVVQEDAAGGTGLSGEFVDRSHLHGILDRLRGLGVDILRFEVDPPSSRPLPPADAQHGQADDQPDPRRSNDRAPADKDPKHR